MRAGVSVSGASLTSRQPCPVSPTPLTLGGGGGSGPQGEALEEEKTGACDSVAGDRLSFLSPWSAPCTARLHQPPFGGEVFGGEAFER